jgi:photosystem II stability/assembly factor-like uncharacterized protein
VRVTQDGGKTWLPSPAPAAGQSWRIRGAGAPQARYIRFANQQDGWIYGPGFFSSHDGGFTWFDETESRQVLAVEVSHGNTWVIQRECAGSEMCRYSLLTSSDNGYTWSQPKTLPNLPSEKIELIQRDENTAWLLSAGSPDFGLDHYLAVTSDGGSTWRELHVPCAHEETAAPHIAEVGGTDLWIICARPAEGNQQEKIISHSKDGGTSWARIQSLPTGGTLDEFMMLTPQRGLASLEPSTLLITGDSGHSWEQSLGAEAFPSPTTNLASAGGWACFFLDAQYGWVALHNVLFQTSDGGKNWSHQNVE